MPTRESELGTRYGSARACRGFRCGAQKHRRSRGGRLSRSYPLKHRLRPQRLISLYPVLIHGRIQRSL